LIFAISRPHAVVTLPSEQRTIILAMDVSLSMRATDVQPAVSPRRAKRRRLRPGPAADVRIGVVAFAGSASVTQRPTRDREELTAAIDRLQLQTHTAIGSGLILSLATLFPNEGIESELESYGCYGGIARDKPAAPRSTSRVRRRRRR
jgi:Ca-activated chloride channel family protein